MRRPTPPGPCMTRTATSGKDREGLARIDPFRREAWERSLALAEEAAQLGFDEIQFDYVRFPDTGGLTCLPMHPTERRAGWRRSPISCAMPRASGWHALQCVHRRCRRPSATSAWNQQRHRTLASRVEDLATAHVDIHLAHALSVGLPASASPATAIRWQNAPYEIVRKSLLARRIVPRRTANTAVRLQAVAAGVHATMPLAESVFGER